MSRQCEYCPFVASLNKSSTSLTSHVKRYHKEECRFRCSQCDEKFLQKRSLDRHENLAHGNGGFPCEICERNLCSEQALKKHLDRIHPTDGSNDCKKCEFKASNSIELRSHVDNVHDTGGKYSCQKCSFITAKQTVLKTHVKKAHQTENQCPACGKNYTSQGIVLKFLIDFSPLVFEFPLSLI